MENLIDSSNFTGEFNLPGEILSGDNELIEGYIAKYQEEILTRLLGYTLYADMEANITATHWAEFIAGKVYTYDMFNKTYKVKYTGIRDVITAYVYYNYLKDNVTSTGVNGEMMGNVENAVLVSMTPKMVNAWNRMVDLYGSPSKLPLIPSAYAYLTKYETSFDNWLFEPIEKINVWSI